MIVLIRPVSVYSWFLSNACCCCVLGVKVETTHSATMKRKYTVWGVSNLSAEKLQFEIEDEASKRRTKTTVARYFFDTYRLPLRYICCFSVYILRAYKKTLMIDEKHHLLCLVVISCFAEKPLK